MMPTMKNPERAARRPAPVVTGEPVGIVISRGREAEAAPRFSAYMYGPAPEEREPREAVLTAV